VTDEHHFNDVNPDFLSADDADRLLSGRLDSGAAPEGTAELAALFSIIREAGTDAELAAETTAVAAFAAAVGVAPATAPTRKSVRSKIFSFKTAAVFGATLFSAGIAAAATGNLPDPVQRAVSNTVSHVGIDLPRPVESTRIAPTTVAPAETTRVGSGDDVKAGEPVSGNCQAELEHEKHADSTLPAQVEKELSDAAAAKHETVSELCAHEAATATANETSGKNGNSSTTTAAPSDHGGPGPSGASTTVAPGGSGSGKGNSGSGNSGSGNSGSGNSGKGGGRGSGDSTTTTTTGG
jgi:hypothetical protein